MFEPIEILGLFATALSCMASIPQTIKIVQTKDAGSVSTETYLILIISYISWGIYAYHTSSLSLLVASTLTLISASTVLIAKYLLQNKQITKPVQLHRDVPQDALNHQASA